MTTITGAGAKVIEKNGRNTNIKRVDIDDAVMKVKTIMKATPPCRLIHPHLPGAIADITQRSANVVKIRRGSTTKEKRTNINTNEREEIVITVAAHHNLRQMLIQYL